MLPTPTGFRQRRRGSVLVIVAVCLIVLMGVVAIALDGGVLLDERRHAQAVADASALAAAADLYDNYALNAGIDLQATAANSAKANAAANGYTDDHVNSFVTVNLPPANYQEGAKAGSPIPAGYVEVIVEYRKKRGFSALFGSGDLPVRARAVARGRWVPATSGLMALNPTARYSFIDTGGATISVSGCSVIVNSSHAVAASIQNGHVTVTGGGATFITGNTDTPSGFTPSAVTGSPPQPDPFSYLPDPTWANGTFSPGNISLPDRTSSITSSVLNSSSARTIYPGRYSVPSAGWSFNLNGSLTLAGEGATNANGTPIQPGEAIYVFEGGPLKFLNGNSPLQSNGGVMVCLNPSGIPSYVTGGSGNPSTSAAFRMTTDASMNLQPLTAGPYKGMTLFLNRASQNSIYISGNQNITAGGSWYMKKGHFEIQSNGGITLAANMVADTIAVTGSGGMTVNYSSPHANVREIRLVE